MVASSSGKIAPEEAPLTAFQNNSIKEAAPLGNSSDDARNKPESAIMQSKVKDGQWGVIMRVAPGAFISIADMITDLLTIERFFREGKRGFALACVAMVGLCAVIQILVVYTQNRKRGVSRISQESLLVLSCLKPGVDAYRVCRGEEPHVDDTFDAMMEFLLAKQAEM